MRLFIALELPGPVREHLVRVCELLKPKIQKASFTRDANLHITLKFLGEVDSKRLDNLTESLALIRASGLIELRAEGIECFPNRGPVRIVAARFGGNFDAIISLHRAIEQRCQHLGFERETRVYRPHVTLVRARPMLPQSLRNSLENDLTAEFPGPPFSISQFALIQSHLSPQGSEYKTLTRFPLDPNIS